MTVKIALSIAALITKVERRLAKYPNNRIISVSPNNKSHEAKRQLSSFGSALSIVASIHEAVIACASGQEAV